MANNYKSDQPKFTINASDNYILGKANNGLPNMYAVHIVNDNSLSASIVVKARSAAREADRNNGDVAFAAIPYISLHLNGSAGTGAYVSTAITGTSVILIPTHGLEVSLDVTYTSGSGSVYVRPFEGAA